MRLDKYLSEKFSFTRTKAKLLIERGRVKVNGETVIKPAFDVTRSDALELEKLPEYASFGGEKLAKALDEFHFDVSSYVCADIGASNGGFTSCLVMRGAKKVFAVDVGECALPPVLKDDERVVVMDRTNARYLTPQKLGEECDFVCIDVSFISLELILPAACDILRKGGHIIALIKPQFEAGKKALSKRGIVMRAPDRQKAADKIRAAGKALGLEEEGFTTAPVHENKNIEYLILFCKK